MVLKKYRWAILPTVVLCSLFVLLLIGYLTERTALNETKTRMENTLAFQTATLKASMEKYTVLAALIARRPDIIRALSSKNLLQDLPTADQLTTDFAGLSGADDVWIVDVSGSILISNRPLSQSPTISNKEFFKSALQGSLGRASVVTNTGQRLYIFASPVFNNNQVVGVIVVRVDLEYLERVWVLLQDPMLVIDETGRILLSSIPTWRLKSFYNETELGNTEREIDRYLVEKFTTNSRDRLMLYQVLDKDRGRDFLQVTQYVALLGWEVHALSNYQSIAVQRNTVVLISFLMMALLAMAFGLWLSRQKRLVEEQRSQQAFALRLERQVRDRTHELTTTNQQLEIEIDERRLAEKHLREAQQELVQAAKLAGIGQMSAVLAHEYNQPLAAIRSYADNATTFLSKDNADAATDNLQRINMLVDKMASLTNTLRNFTHKSTSEFKRFSINGVMDELVILLSPQAKKQQVKLNLIAPEHPVFVMGEHGRLSQIVANLVTNAMDAVNDSSIRKVDVCWYQELDKAIILVKDTGPGVDDKIKEKMFDAFFTTKGTDSGLGLGLFIVMNIINDFNGSLSLKEEQGYGAVFEIVLPLAE